MSEGPLAGVRVVDLTRILSGPFCTMLLADMGAEVIKIEPLDGDPIRGQGAETGGISWYYATFNRNKRSIALDLRKPEGIEVLEGLIRRADVLAENFRPGVLTKMGLSDERLAELNPRLVIGSVNGYGSTGPYVDRPAFDFIAQAMSGFMSVNGHADGEPMRSGPPLSDLLAGLYCAFGILCALQERARSGRGQRVEAAMTNALISMFAYLASDYFVTGEVPARSGNDHPIISPYGLFHARDGEVAVAPSTPAILQRFMDELGLASLLEEERFATNAERMRNRAELNALIDERMRAGSQADWIDRLNRAGVPCGRVQNLREAFDDPQARAQGMAVDVEHPGHGTVRVLGLPVKLERTPASIRLPAPEVGGDTDAVLRELGWDEDAVASLRARDVLR